MKVRVFPDENSQFRSKNNTLNNAPVGDWGCLAMMVETQAVLVVFTALKSGENGSDISCYQKLLEVVK